MAAKKRSAPAKRSSKAAPRTRKTPKASKKKAAQAKPRSLARAASKGRAGGRAGTAARKRASAKPLKSKTAPARKPARKAPPARGSSSKKARTAPARTTGTRAGGSRRGSTAGARTAKRAAPPAKKPVEKKPPRPSTFSAAVKLYENGFRLMHAEKFDRAKAVFEQLISEYPEETELLDRAHVLIHVCEKRLAQAQKGPKLRGADDYYEVGVAELNRRELEQALDHLQHALKLQPKGDHILYALAAASAVAGKRDEALGYLKKSIHYREENRYLAANDADFGSLAEDPDYRKLITPDEG